MRSLLLSLVPCLTVSASALLLVTHDLPAAQQPTDAARLVRAASGDVFRAHLQFLADDALEGRAPGTRGGDLAAKYIAAQFERLGLEPAGDSGSYFHRVPILAHIPEPAVAIGRAKLRYRDDYVLWSMRNEEVVTARGELVFGGYGIVAPEYQWNDYAGLDVKNKIVVTLVNDPGLRDSTLFKGKALTYYGRWTYKIEEAARQGAAGILLVHTTESATYPWTTVTGSWTGEQVRLERPPSSLVVAGWVTDSAAAAIFAAAGKDFSRLSTLAAARGFAPLPLGVEIEAVVKSTLRRSETFNVLARLPGRPARQAEAVLIGGHYDHLGFGDAVNGDSIYNGAEDNASGTAAVVTAAEAFVSAGVRPSRSILFMAFAAEESGLLGADAFVAAPTLPLANLVAVLNMDGMNLYGRTADVAALGVDQSSLGALFKAAAAAEQLSVTVNQDAIIKGYFFRSDHFPFVKAGVPGLSLQSGLAYVGRPRGWGQQQQDEYTARRYHQPSDEILPWFTVDGALQQLRVFLRAALAVANASAQPYWLQNSEFKSAREARIGQ